MTKTPAENAADLAKLAGQFVEAVAEQEVQMLHLVQAEMAVLTGVAQAAAKPHPAPADQAETEAGFDNMPV